MPRENPPVPGHGLRCMEIWGGSGVMETEVSTPGLDAWVYSRPHEGSASGGDVHYVSLCGGGIVTKIILADVSGHGAAVSDAALRLRELMRRNINRKDQTRLVRELNRQFAALEEAGHFATAVVATYLATTDRLAFCNAGHPHPLWYRAAEGRWDLLTGSGAEPGSGLANLPLGIDESSGYEQFAITLGADDLLLLYTDALTEASDASGTPLGEGGLLALARGLDPSPPSRFGPALLRAVGHYRGDLPADDDVTLMTLHHNAGPPAPPTLGEKLDVYAKVFGLRAF